MKQKSQGVRFSSPYQPVYLLAREAKAVVWSRTLIVDLATANLADDADFSSELDVRCWASSSLPRDFFGVERLLLSGRAWLRAASNIRSSRKRRDPMRHPMLGLTAATLLVAATAFAAAPKKMVCSETGKEVKACCCDIKDGKFVCKFTHKTFDKCCCASK
ncbi:MAG: hypothetical protein DMF46_05245 [Verrucomicrobia bacterium]|nr:MAG: hypothetical protein DMF46_05245 [Verrucomicrobiota bacterium]